jgi:hypothetical protein
MGPSIPATRSHFGPARNTGSAIRGSTTRPGGAVVDWVVEQMPDAMVECRELGISRSRRLEPPRRWRRPRGVSTVRTTVVAGALCLFVVACGGTAEPPASSGREDRIAVEVTVTLGPGCPVERAGVPCPSVPLTGSELVATSNEQTVRRDLPDDGRIRLDLDDATWQITATAGMSCETVTVSASGPVVVACDTGIR